ncbi:GDP-mannose 4,6-dehydratase [uncultured archaeon]|nr:GDP-mannose 4,6-dehydratase [uncultured archaeon]
MEKERAWITGACGFMGQHLTDFLIKKGYSVLSTTYHPTTNIKELNPQATIMECDIRDKKRVYSIIESFQPSKIFHLAAQSYPTVSWEDPWYTIETNVLGTTNIFEGVKRFAPECRILNACTSGEYGFVTAEEVPIKEEHPLNPLHPYGVSKLAQEKLAAQYFQNFGIQSISVRIFNTTGPKKVNDVCSDFTRRLIEIEKGKNLEKRLLVGRTDTQRAITDVRDIINAFDIALDKATIGEVYNLSGDQVYRIGDIIELLKGMVDFDFGIKIDSKLIRPTDEPIIYGDSSKFKKETGWSQKIPLETTLKDMLNYWRETL